MSDLSDRNPPNNNHYKEPSLHEASASVESNPDASGDYHSDTIPADTLQYACEEVRHAVSNPLVWHECGWQPTEHRYLPEPNTFEPWPLIGQTKDRWVNDYLSDKYFERHHETSPEYFTRGHCVDQGIAPSGVKPENLPYSLTRVCGEKGLEGRGPDERRVEKSAPNRLSSSYSARSKQYNAGPEALEVSCVHAAESRREKYRKNSAKGQPNDGCHQMDSTTVSLAPIQYHEPLGVLVEKMTPVIKLTARRLKAQSRIPMHVDMEDLIQAGTVGLIEASQRFNPKQGASFETYAIKRIQGAMVDELRSSDWLPRSLRRHAREAEQIHNRLEQYHGGPIRDRDIAAVMEVPLNTYNRHQNEVHNCQLLDYTDYDLETFLPEEEVEPLNRLLSDELHGLLQLAIASLDDEREREALTLYRLSGNSLRTIGERMGVSDSRVCQLHKRAMAKIRAWFQQYFPELEYIGNQNHGDSTSDPSEKPITYRTYSFRGGPLPPRD